MSHGHQNLYGMRRIAGAFTLSDPRIQPEPNTGCWLWARKLGADGYAVTLRCGSRKAVKVHRAVWEIMRGPIPKGMFLDHVCRERSCVNPDHLRVVTPRENALENSVGACACNASKVACGVCDGPLTIPPRGGRRECRHCARAGSRRWYNKHVKLRPRE